MCVFPAFSTLISAAFGVIYLLSLWYITGAIASAAINKMLARRIRALQVRPRGGVGAWPEGAEECL